MKKFLSFTLLCAIAVFASACAATPTPAPQPVATTAPPTSAPTAVPASPTAAPVAQPLKIRFALNPTLVVFAPVYYALEKGYFKEAGLDVEVVKHRTAAVEMIPQLVRGDVDLLQTTPAPATFNAVAQGFNIKLVAAINESKEGFAPGGLLVVRKEVWDSGAIKELKDMKGKRIDAAAEGTNLHAMTVYGIERAGLTKNDVTLTHKARTPDDMVALLKQNAVDIQATVEPLATKIQQDGLGVKWLSINELAPGYQAVFLGSSEKVLSERPEAVKRFLKVYIKANLEMQKAGTWTPDLLKATSKWTEMDEKTILALGPLPYMRPDGRISPDALSKVQALWFSGGLVKQEIPVKNLIDNAILDAVLKELNIP